MTPHDEPPAKITPIQCLGIFVCIGSSMLAVFGTLIASAWFIPSPWYLLGAVPATVGVWVVLRESVIETLVIFIILLFLLSIGRSAIQQVRQRFQMTVVEGTQQTEIVQAGSLMSSHVLLSSGSALSDGNIVRLAGRSIFQGGRTCQTQPQSPSSLPRDEPRGTGSQ